MQLPEADVLVVGAGVSGLTTAVVLREAGISAHIVTKDMPAQTTSDVAAAIWYPTLAAPLDRCLAWGRRSLDILYDMAGGLGAGVFVCEVREFLSEPADPAWIGGVRSHRELEHHELPPGRDHGIAVEVPRVEPPIYLRHLVDRFTATGGILFGEAIEDLRGLAAERGVVVNCTGLASGHLLGDEEVYPVRGQVVLIENPGIRRGLLDEVDGEDITYVLPRTHEVVLGGTRQPGNWDPTPDKETTERILSSCTRLEPMVADAEIIMERVGLRPGRSSVRLEAEPVDGGVLIHNYGHDGSGYSLSWGCAEEVRDLVSEALER
jgi:D-amino-acid oxidase